MLGVHVCTYVLYLSSDAPVPGSGGIAAGFGGSYLSLFPAGLWRRRDTTPTIAAVSLLESTNFKPDSFFLSWLRIPVLLGQFVFQPDCMMPCFLRLIYLLPQSNVNTALDLSCGVIKIGQWITCWNFLFPKTLDFYSWRPGLSPGSLDIRYKNPNPKIKMETKNITTV